MRAPVEGPDHELPAGVALDADAEGQMPPIDPGQSAGSRWSGSPPAGARASLLRSPFQKGVRLRQLLVADQLRDISEELDVPAALLRPDGHVTWPQPA